VESESSCLQNGRGGTTRGLERYLKIQQGGGQPLSNLVRASVRSKLKRLQTEGNLVIDSELRRGMAGRLTKEQIRDDGVLYGTAYVEQERLTLPQILSTEGLLSAHSEIKMDPEAPKTPGH